VLSFVLWLFLFLLIAVAFVVIGSLGWAMMEALYG
jgi:hypothetical protein